MSKKPKIPADPHGGADRQPTLAEALQGADVSADQPAAEGSEGEHQAGAAETAAVAGATDPSSTDTPPESLVAAGTDASKSVPAEESHHLFPDPVDEFKTQFPLASALLEQWHSRSPDLAPTALRIVSQRDGFWRAGKQHSRTPVEHLLVDLHYPEQIEQLLAEPMLTVELV